MQLSAQPDDLARQLSTFLRYMATKTDGEFLEAVSEQDLSLSQLKTMSLLADAPAALSVKGVADELGISLPSASRAVDSLVRRKLVAREEDDLDRRVKRLRLTAKGSALAERLIAARVASLQRMLEDFDDAERRKLASALAAILERPEFTPYRREREKAPA